MKTLVTGGAGYVGSHTVRCLLDRGHSVVVYDNLRTGHQGAIDRRAIFVRGDILAENLLASVLKDHGIEAVLHFAGSTEVAESLLNPGLYNKENVEGTLHVLKAMSRTNVKKMVFSSTAAVYGNPTSLPIDEKFPTSPLHPYGETKLISEKNIQKESQNSDLRFAILRYFNVAGAWPDGSMGEDHRPETHLIPRILKSILQGENTVCIFGDDYATPDGSCLRDYVHVVDLAQAHLLALEGLPPQGGEIFNLGSEQGFSVKEIVSACEKVTGVKLKREIGLRRDGDSPALVACSEKIRRTLNWQREHSEIEIIIQHAWNWHKGHPSGFGI
jgi:UDP-glucose 4-epimerase